MGAWGLGAGHGASVLPVGCCLEPRTRRPGWSELRSAGAGHGASALLVGCSIGPRTRRPGWLELRAFRPGLPSGRWSSRRPGSSRASAGGRVARVARPRNAARGARCARPRALDGLGRAPGFLLGPPRRSGFWGAALRRRPSVLPGLTARGPGGRRSLGNSAPGTRGPGAGHETPESQPRCRVSSSEPGAGHRAPVPDIELQQARSQGPPFHVEHPAVASHGNPPQPHPHSATGSTNPARPGARQAAGWMGPGAERAARRPAPFGKETPLPPRGHAPGARPRSAHTRSSPWPVERARSCRE